MKSSALLSNPKSNFAKENHLQISGWLIPSTGQCNCSQERKTNYNAFFHCLRQDDWFCKLCTVVSSKSQQALCLSSGLGGVNKSLSSISMENVCPSSASEGTNKRTSSSIQTENMTCFRLGSNQCTENHFWNHENWKEKKKNQPCTTSTKLESIFVAEPGELPLGRRRFFPVGFKSLMISNNSLVTPNRPHRPRHQRVTVTALPAGLTRSQKSLVLFKDRILCRSHMPDWRIRDKQGRHAEKARVRFYLLRAKPKHLIIQLLSPMTSCFFPLPQKRQHGIMEKLQALEAGGPGLNQQLLKFIHK